MQGPETHINRMRKQKQDEKTHANWFTGSGPKINFSNCCTEFANNSCVVFIVDFDGN